MLNYGAHSAGTIAFLAFEKKYNYVYAYPLNGELNNETF